ncbi:hypothetical protein EW145_g1813 [Phellinidium pouzarii]|uniref:Uncharacterized protein n=1 Tax=Phellinidium pouzarii TaxID=167371 RepID=A0A4S4LD57_9AGAM|nr:hypothetical protein EW145_g1813 [Phellinidium pouzarii]
MLTAASENNNKLHATEAAGCNNSKHYRTTDVSQSRFPSLHAELMSALPLININPEEFHPHQKSILLVELPSFSKAAFIRCRSTFDKFPVLQQYLRLSILRGVVG